MREFFINSLEKLVAAIIVILAVAVVIGALSVMFGNQPGSGFLPGLFLLLAGAAYVIAVGGFMYLALGIHDNTKRTAAAVEKLASKG